MTKTQTFEDKRREKLSGDLRLKVFNDDKGALAKCFADKSYAIVGDDMFVPLIPRHMTNDNWRELFWRGVKKVVIHGRKYKSLCNACRLGLSCLSKGNGRRYEFECKASGDNMIVPLTTRKRGEP
jgi:hypothetical protein